MNFLVNELPEVRPVLSVQAGNVAAVDGGEVGVGHGGGSQCSFKASPRPSAAGVLRQIPMRGLFADVLLFVVAMALGGVEGNGGRAAGALVALIVVGNGLDGFGRRFRHGCLRYARWENAGRVDGVPGNFEQADPQALVLPDGQITLLLGPVGLTKIFRLARRANQL